MREPRHSQPPLRTPRSSFFSFVDSVIIFRSREKILSSQDRCEILIILIKRTMD